MPTATTVEPEVEQGTLRVPDLVGIQATQAIEELRALGLLPTTMSLVVDGDDSQAGYVVALHPPATTPIRARGRVKISVARRPQRKSSPAAQLALDITSAPHDTDATPPSPPGTRPAASGQHTPVLTPPAENHADLTRDTTSEAAGAAGEWERMRQAEAERFAAEQPGADPENVYAFPPGDAEPSAQPTAAGDASSEHQQARLAARRRAHHHYRRLSGRQKLAVAVILTLTLLVALTALSTHSAQHHATTKISARVRASTERNATRRRQPALTRQHPGPAPRTPTVHTVRVRTRTRTRVLTVTVTTPAPPPVATPPAASTPPPTPTTPAVTPEPAAPTSQHPTVKPPADAAHKPASAHAPAVKNASGAGGGSTVLENPDGQIVPPSPIEP